jgi:hypothetical protein
MSIANQAAEGKRSPITIETHLSGAINASSRSQYAGLTVVVGPLPPPKHDWMRVRHDPQAWHRKFSGRSLMARVDLPAAPTAVGDVVFPTLLVARLSDSGMSELVVFHRDAVEVGTQLTVTLFDSHSLVQQGEPFHIVVGNAKA